MSFEYLQILQDTAMKSIIKSFPKCIFILTTILLIISDEIHAKRVKRLYGGVKAKSGQQNWVVSLALKADAMENFCGGAIIGRRHILTAAHCFDRVLPSQVIVRSGIIKLNDRTAIVTGVSKLIPHPEYVPKMRNAHAWNDIAVLELKNDLPFGNRTSEIRLPTKEPQEETGFFAGWGHVEEGCCAMTPLLHTVQMKVISDRECEAKGRPGRRPQFICVYFAGGRLLEGDSGSPLTHNGEIIGIASSGRRIIGLPTSFTNVFHYADWIEKIISSENEVSVYTD